MRFLTRKLVQPYDLNAGGTLYGGRCLEWIDQEAAIYAMTEARHPRMVTKSISAIKFVAPAFQGDIIEIGVALKSVGKTYLVLEIIVRNLRTQQIIVNVDEMIFVAVNEKGRPERHGLTR
jgi:acyl-CoA thioesterase YciA